MWVGTAKLLFGLLVATVGGLLASRLLSRLLGLGRVEEELKRGNVAVALLEVGALLSLALLCKPAVEATFTSMDYLYRGRGVTPAVLLEFARFGFGHVGLALAVGAGVMATGTLLYAGLTRRVDEIAAVREGNPAPALVIAAVMVAMALLAEPGLETMLDGLIPMPVLLDTEHAR